MNGDTRAVDVIRAAGLVIVTTCVVVLTVVIVRDTRRLQKMSDDLRATAQKLRDDPAPPAHTEN